MKYILFFWSLTVLHENDITCGRNFKKLLVETVITCHCIFSVQHFTIIILFLEVNPVWFFSSFSLWRLPLLFQLLAVTEERSHLGVCSPISLCHCGEEFAKISICHFLQLTICCLIKCPLTRALLPSVLNVFNLLSDFQVNIGILISVTRIISRISGENYKVHGDANSIKWVYQSSTILSNEYRYFI